jgi:hypothetical protein
MSFCGALIREENPEGRGDMIFEQL